MTDPLPDPTPDQPEQEIGRIDWLWFENRIRDTLQDLDEQEIGYGDALALIDKARADLSPRSALPLGLAIKGGRVTDQPSREGPRPTLTELAAITRAGNIAGVNSEWLASTLQAAEAEIKELKRLNSLYIDAADASMQMEVAAEARESALREGLREIEGLNSVDDPERASEIARSLLSTQEPTR